MYLIVFISHTQKIVRQFKTAASARFRFFILLMKRVHSNGLINIWRECSSFICHCLKPLAICRVAWNTLKHLNCYYCHYLLQWVEILKCAYIYMSCQLLFLAIISMELVCKLVIRDNWKGIKWMAHIIISATFTIAWYKIWQRTQPKKKRIREGNLYVHIRNKQKFVSNVLAN